MKRTVFTLSLLLLLLALVLLGPTTPAQDPAPEDQELETFVPSEELPADSAVSFPVDI